MTRHTRRGLRPATALRLAATLLLALLVPFAARAEFLDWTDVTWPAGSLGPRAYTGGDLGSTSVTTTVIDANGSAPAGWPQIGAGISGFDSSFRLRADFANTSRTMRLDFAFAAAASDLVFNIGDVDTGSATSPFSGWQDVVIVTAFFGGVEVPVVATPIGTSVRVDSDGNSYSTGLNASLYGNTGNVGDSSSSGNARVSIAGPVDRIRIDYYPGNTTDGIPGQGPSNPDSQVVNVHDLVFKGSADLSLTKVASSTTPTVGNTVTYTLTVTNAGPATATGVRVADVLPAGVTYVAGSIAGGTARNAAGLPTLSWDQATLASGASAVLTYQATVNAPTGAANEYRNAAQVIASAQPDPDSTPNNGTGNGEDDRATVTLTPVTAVAVSGFVYRDDDHDAARGASEPGTGVALFAKLVPAATPGGPASQVVAVDPVTGAFSFAGVTPGTYSIVIDTTNTASDVTPTFVAGWLGTEESDFVRSITVAASALTGQNYGLYHGSRVRGVVFDDAGAGGGIAGNGLRDGAEPGIASVAVRATAAGCGASCDATTSDATGAFTLWIPFAANGQTVTVTESNAAGYVSTGGSPGTSGGSYTLATDSVAFTHTSGSDLTGLAFGDRQTADLSLTKVASNSTPNVGSTVTYTLTLTNSGPAAGTGITVADVLPAGVTYVAGSIAGGNSRSAVPPTLTWNVTTLASGASTNLSFNATVNAPTGAAGEYDNRAQVTAAQQPDPDSTPNNGTGNAEDDRGSAVITPPFCAVTLVPNRSSTISASQTVYLAHTLTNTGNASDAFDLVSVRSGSFTPAPIAYYRDLGTVGQYDAGVDVLLTDTDGDTIPDTGTLAAAASLPLLVAATAPNAAISGSASVVTTATSSLHPSCNGGTAAFASATDTLNAGSAVSGNVYADANHDSTRNSGETGTGLVLYAKLIPAAAPAGPASQVVAVDPATGAYAFVSVTAGSWILIYDTSNAAVDVTPTLPAGWLRTEEADATRNITVTATNLAAQNFGLFHGSRVEGVVFDDDGASGGVAGNGLLDGFEAGIAGVAVRAQASGCAGVCDTAATAANGAFALWIPFGAAGQSVAVIETNLAAFVSTGGSAGTTGGSYAIATDSVTFSNATGTVYTAVRFADYLGSSFAPNHQRAAMPGTAVFYPHVFAAGPSGTVRFSATNVASPGSAGWAQAVFHDTDCSGTLDAAEPQLQPAAAVAVAAGGLVCVVVRESVPPGAPSGAQDLVTVRAEFSAAGGASARLTVTDLTTVGLPSGLVLAKSVDKTSALPGAVLVYTIAYRNDGAAPITQLVIGDATPSYTTFVPASAGCGALPPQLGSCTPAPPPGSTGSVTWTFTGALDPGASGTVSYSVTID